MAIRTIPDRSGIPPPQADPGFIFIDANQYLTLYNVIKGKKLLQTLIEQKDHILVTAQVVAEVQRNKLQIAQRFFRDNLKLFQLPDHMFDASDTVERLREKVSPIAKQSSEIEGMIEGVVSETLAKISQSKDEVSKGLAILFQKAVPHSQDELERARLRRELGNPPGKHEDILGDQLNWEQILSKYKTQPKLWLVTNDTKEGDFFCEE